MLAVAVTLLICVTKSYVNGLPISTAVSTNSTARQEFPEEGELFEGDIILRSDQLSLLKVNKFYIVLNTGLFFQVSDEV